MHRFRPQEIVQYSSGQAEKISNAGKLRIGFVMHKMQVAGAEILVAEIIRQLKDKIDPTVFCLDAVGQLGEQLLSEGVRVVSLDRKPGRDWGVALRLRDAIRQQQIQVLHAHQYSPFFYSALAKILCRGRVKLIFTEHGRHYPDRVSPLRRMLNRLLLDRTADSVNAVCQFAADAVCQVDGFRGQRIEVLPNGIDLQRYQQYQESSQARQKLGVPANRQAIGLIARFHPVKDHPMALRAFATIAKLRPNVGLYLVGDGPDRLALQSLCQQLSIEDRVHFLGIRQDIPDILQAMDVFMLTSVSEAASLTLMEAMAASKAIVVTNVGGNPELIEHGETGLLVPRGDHAACAQGLMEFLDQPSYAKRLGQNAWRKARDCYDLKLTVKRYHSLYRRVLGHVICDD